MRVIFRTAPVPAFSKNPKGELLQGTAYFEAIVYEPGESSPRGLDGEPARSIAFWRSSPMTPPRGRRFPELWTKERLEPHEPKAVLLMTFFDGDTYVGVSKTFELKLRALKAHASQVDANEMEGW